MDIIVSTMMSGPDKIDVARVERSITDYLHPTDWSARAPDLHRQRLRHHEAVAILAVLLGAARLRAVSAEAPKPTMTVTVRPIRQLYMPVEKRKKDALTAVSPYVAQRLKRYCISCEGAIASLHTATLGNIVASLRWNGHTYVIVTEALTWAAAKARAEAMGGSLAQVTSSVEDVAIFNFAMQERLQWTVRPTAPDGGGAEYVWLGASDAAVEGTWRWTDGTALAYENWGNGLNSPEPDNYEDQDAVGMALTAWPYGVAGEWNDIDVSNTLYFVVEFDGLAGTEGADTIESDQSGDKLLGLGGDDRLQGWGGNDLLDGGTGTDTAVYSGAMADYTIAFNTDGTITIIDRRGTDGTDTLKNVERLAFSDQTVSPTPPQPPVPPQPPTVPAPTPLNLRGTNTIDVLMGEAADDKLWGLGGNDKLFGNEGDDKLYGGLGNDLLTGDLGRDIFVFDTKLGPKKNLDRITDFNVNDDTIHLAKSVFSKIAKKGSLAKAAFWSGSKAHDANDRIIYNKKTGALFYDPDGNGDLKQIQFATITKKLPVTAADFLVI